MGAFSSQTREAFLSAGLGISIALAEGVPQQTAGASFPASLKVSQPLYPTSGLASPRSAEKTHANWV